MNSKKETVWVTGKYNFDDSELKEISQKTAIVVKEMEDVETEKKNAVADFNEQLKTMETELRKLAHHTREKSEIREFECYVERHLDRQMKEYYWIVDGRFVKQEPMTAEEVARMRQEKFDFGDGDGLEDDESKPF